MKIDDPGPMSIDAADRRRPDFADQFRRLEEEWPDIIGPRPLSDDTPIWLNVVRPSDICGKSLTVISNNPSESIRVLALADAIVAKSHAIGLVEIDSVLIDPIKRGSYQDAVDDIRRKAAVWASVRVKWDEIASGRGRPVDDAGDALIIEINIDTTDDVWWFGQHQVHVVRAVRTLGLEHISNILLRPVKNIGNRDDAVSRRRETACDTPSTRKLSASDPT